MLNLEKLLYRILLGYYYININDEIYKVINPTFDIRYQAELLYEKTIEENKYNRQWLTEQEIEFYLLTNGIWHPNDSKKLKTFEDSIEDAKIDIFRNFLNAKHKDKIKKELKSLRNQQAALLNKKRSMDHLGIKDQALSIKNEYIIRHCIYNKDNTLVFNPEEDNCTHMLLQLFIKEVVDNSIDISDMKALARSDLWRSYASSCVIEKDVLNTNDDYKYLINLHKMYDNARQHPEAPSEDIINDDDALDGWFLVQHRKTKEDKKKSIVKSKIGDRPLGQHNFIFTDNEEEAKAIMDSNSPREKFFAEQVIKYASENPGVKWSDIPMVKTQMQNELSEQLRGRK